MERVFTSELLRMLGILGLGGFSLMAIVGRVVGKIRGSFQPYLKNSVLYILVAGLIAAAIAFLGQPALFKVPLRSFIILQLLFLSLGILHIYTLPKILDWAADEKAFFPGLLFSIITAVFAYLFFIIVFKWINPDGYHYLAGSSVLLLVLPYTVYHTFVKAMDVPPKIFRQWFYPVNEEVQEPDEDKLKNMLVISFEFQKNVKEPHFTNFRAKAPRDMEFGQLFYYFINDYNERHPNGKIEYKDENEDACGWIFYKKQRWYTISTTYLDPEKSFYANRVRENDVIVCSRSTYQPL